VLIGILTWLPGQIMLSDWLKKNKARKQMDRLDFDLEGMFIRCSCTNFSLWCESKSPRWPASLDMIVNLGP